MKNDAALEAIKNMLSDGSKIPLAQYMLLREAGEHGFKISIIYDLPFDPAVHVWPTVEAQNQHAAISERRRQFIVALDRSGFRPDNRFPNGWMIRVDVR